MKRNKRMQLFTFSILSLSLLLTGCSKGTKEEKEEYKMLKESKVFLESYSEDDTDQYVYKDKSEQEIKEEIVRGMLGLREKDERYRKEGFVAEQGVFVESGILKGGTIPTTTTLRFTPNKELDNEEKAKNNKKLALKKELDELMISNYGEVTNVNVSEEDVADEITKKVMKRKEQVGKERDYHDLTEWTFSPKIESKYTEELSELRKTIKSRNDLMEVKNRVKELKNQVKDAEKLRELDKTLKQNEKETDELYKMLTEQEKDLKEKLDKDKEFTEDEKKGIKEQEVTKEKGKEKETSTKKDNTPEN